MRLGRTRRKIKRLQKGGSVPFLDADALGYPTPESIEANMDLFTISCHGETTDDRYFFVVPPNTYCMFSAHSGEYAEGKDPTESSYISYTGDRSTFYTKLYTQLFRPHTERAAFGPFYKESLYIYKPGDIIPDYVLTFKNTFAFMFRHGIYKLPIEALSGRNSVQDLYIGKPLYFIKKALNSGKLSVSDLDELVASDKMAVFEKSLEELQGIDGILSTKRFYTTTLFEKIEKMCCRGPDNLLFQAPFDPEALKAAWYTIRLSTVLNMLPKDPSKRDRFFLMNFCRVSYADIAETYSSNTSALTSTGPLLRTMSFGAKCGGTHGTDAAFNVFQILDLFCGFSRETKVKLLKYEPVRKCIAVLKHGSTIPFSTWETCLEGTYEELDYDTRLELVSDYTGYFTLEDILFLSSFYTELDKIGTTTTNSGVRDACQQLARPFQTLYIQLQEQTKKFQERLYIKTKKIDHIYRLLKSKLSPYRAPDYDFLRLQSATHDDLDKLIEHLSTDFYDEDIKEYKSQIQNGDYTTSEAKEEALYDIFKLYTGTQGVPSEIELFSTEPIINTSISFRNLRGALQRNRVKSRLLKEYENVLLAVNNNTRPTNLNEPAARKSRRRSRI